MVNLNVKDLDFRSRVPNFGHDDKSNAGIDIYSAEKRIIWPKTKVVIKTGIAIQPVLSPNFPHKTPFWFKEFVERNFKTAVIVKSRSGLSVKNSIEHGAGVIDEGYRGEIKIILYNHGWLPKRIKSGDKVAQLVTHLLPEVSINMVEDLDYSLRGTKGFGSSGTA